MNGYGRSPNQGRTEFLTNIIQNHYEDLKYAMQFLLAQWMGKKNLKASIKALDQYVQDAQMFVTSLLRMPFC